MNSTDSCHLLFFIIVSPREGGDISRDFTTILAPESRTFSGALKIEKLKAPLIPGPEGAVDTNDWCISYDFQCCNVQFCGCDILLIFAQNKDQLPLPI